MAKFLVRHVSVILFMIHYGSSQNEAGPESELWELPIGVEYRSSFVDLPAEDDVPPLNPDDDTASPREARSIPPLPFINPGIFYNPFEAINPVQAVVFDALVDRFRTDVEIAKQRQNVMLKYVECSSPKASECKPVLARVEVVEDEHPRGYWEWLESVNSQAPGTVTCPPCNAQATDTNHPKGYWEWLASVNPTPPGSVPCPCPPPKDNKAPEPNTKTPLRYYRVPTYWDWLLSVNRPAVDVVRADKFYAVMTAFKESIERLTVRQNVLYEYISCSCPSTTECGAALKPVLDLMFANNQNVTGEMIKDLVTGRRSSIIDTLFGWIPNFNSILSFNPLSVLADLFNPHYSGAASYSTNSGHGGTYTVSSSGKPTNEHYVVHHPGGGTSHISTSTNGGATSVSVVTTDQKKETDEETTDHATSDDTNDEEKSESHAEDKKESHGKYFEDARPGEHLGATNYGPREQSLSNAFKVVQSSLENAKTPDGLLQLSETSSEDAKTPEVHAARRQLFGGGPGMAYPALANQVPAQYTGASPYGFGGVQPGIAAAGIGVNQGLAAAQYTTG